MGGLSESQVYRLHPPSKGKKVLIACGPGNNGDWLEPNGFGIPSLYDQVGTDLLLLAICFNTVIDRQYTIPNRVKMSYIRSVPSSGTVQSLTDGAKRLTTQLRSLDIPFTEDFESSLRETSHVVDAIFGNFAQLNGLTPHLTFSRVQLFWRSSRTISFRH